MNAFVCTLFSAFVCYFVATSEVAAGLQCPGSAVEQAATTGRCISHPRAFPCGDGTTCQCVAALFQLCNAPVTTSWQKGAQVTSNCNNLAKYTPIATFNSQGKYEGHAGIFSRCVGGQIEMFDQWCGNAFSLRRKSATNYYVVVA